MGNTFEYFASRYAFNDSGNLCRAVVWYRLDEKMNMVMISSNLYKLNLVPFGYFKANFLKVCINVLSENNFSVFCRAH